MSEKTLGRLSKKKKKKCAKMIELIDGQVVRPLLAKRAHSEVLFILSLKKSKTNSAFTVF